MALAEALEEAVGNRSGSDSSRAHREDSCRRQSAIGKAFAVTACPVCAWALAEALEEVIEDSSDSDSTWTQAEQARQSQTAIGMACPEPHHYVHEVPWANRDATHLRAPGQRAEISKCQCDRTLSAWRRRLREDDAPSVAVEGSAGDARTAPPKSRSASCTRDEVGTRFLERQPSGCVLRMSIMVEWCDFTWLLLTPTLQQQEDLWVLQCLRDRLHGRTMGFCDEHGNYCEHWFDDDGFRYWERLVEDPCDIKFSQNSISPWFTLNGGARHHVNDVIFDLLSGDMGPDDLPMITVYETRGGKLISHDNRRLHCFQQAMVKNLWIILTNRRVPDRKYSVRGGARDVAIRAG